MYSSDGYALFVASTTGWHLWSVYGRLLASNISREHAREHSSALLDPTINGVTSHSLEMHGVIDCCWASSGLSVIALSQDMRSIFSLPFAKSAVTTCYNPVAFPVKCSHSRIQSHKLSYKQKIAFYYIKAFNNEFTI
jgi:hypothetical protein